jgi:hypothetical protein
MVFLLMVDLSGNNTRPGINKNVVVSMGRFPYGSPLMHRFRCWSRPVLLHGNEP